MANEKRQRQDEARKRKLEALAKVQVAKQRKRKFTRFAWIGGLVALVFGFLLWRGSSGDSGGADTTAPLVQIATTAPRPVVTVSKAQNEALGAKPTATVPASKASKLGTKDLIEGSGPAAKVGDLLQMRYLGVSQNSKKEFDSSWSRGSGATSYLPVELGAGRVIPGWEQGLVGMKVGGRRELVIPADLAYGKNPPSNDIAVDDTLVFVVDLMSLEPRSPATTIATPTVPAPPSVTVPASSASVTTGSTTTAG